MPCPNRSRGSNRPSFAALALFLAALAVLAAPASTFAEPPDVHALTGVRIVVAPGQVIESGTVVLRDGLIEAVGPDVTPPPDARVWEREGVTVYPGLIEPYTTRNWPEEDPAAEAAPEAQVGSPNPLVHPEREMAAFAADASADARLREAGFTAAVVAPRGGLLRGRSVLLGLGEAPVRERVLVPRVAQNVTLGAVHPEGGYPNSLMGSVALTRWSFLDAGWYRRAQAAYREHPSQRRPGFDASLEALAPSAAGEEPVVLESDDLLGLLRSARLADELGLRTWLVASGEEYRRADLVAELAGRLNAPLLVPVAFPEAPEVSGDPIDVALEDLRHWKAAPANPAALVDRGLPVAVTSHRLDQPKELHARMARAIEAGLSPEDALAAVTTVPARLLGVDDRLGTVEPGKIANLVLLEGDLFREETAIQEVWIDGRRYEIEVIEPPEVEPAGTWELQVDAGGQVIPVTLVLEGEAPSLTGSLQAMGSELTLTSARVSGTSVIIEFDGAGFGMPGAFTMTLEIEGDRAEGSGDGPPGPFGLEGTRVSGPPESRVRIARSSERLTAGASRAPAALAALSAGAAGAVEPVAPPERPGAVLVRGATVWTSGSDGRLEDADLLVRDGRIAAVGRGLDAPAGAVVVDGTGKHVTAGLIDAHSHTAIDGSVNEGSDIVTAEVRIADVLDPTDVNIYRQLAGGVTAANVLHGSANAIGGQNAVVKWRWGAPPAELPFDAAPPGIKFALGENPKQSNWNSAEPRYPRTRMGIEQAIIEAFERALDHRRALETAEAAGGDAVPPRPDLRSEAVLEILDGTREVHSHAYRADEMLMLLGLAERYGFELAAFQHALEAYKIADELAAQGVGASTFSDWWAYKYEVVDAIPYNGAILLDRGVVTSFNSDSDELARRLNTEAAKAVRYGGVSEEEALKLVTLYPAIQLGIDHRTGSLEPGKDADFVLWNGHPLSTYARAEQTWVDGRKYFDRAEDLARREEIAAERETILAELEAAADGGQEGEDAEAPEGSDEPESPEEAPEGEREPPEEQQEDESPPKVRTIGREVTR